MGLRKFLLILTIVLVIILGVVIWIFPSNEDFRAENPFWNGISEAVSSYQISPLESLSELPPSPEGASLILIPYQSLQSAELEVLQKFVTQGGTLFLADDYGYGNQVLEYLGLRARFSGQTLLDPLHNYKNGWFPRIDRFKSHPLTSNTESLVFNHATCLTNVGGGDALALSSPFSFLDLNGNQTGDKDEPVGPLPVISQHNLDRGQIILIADPSIFVNSMQTIGSNGGFIQGMADITAASLFIDQSHLPPSNLHHTKHLLAYIHGALRTPLGSVGVVILALVITLIPVWYRKREAVDMASFLPGSQ